MTGLASTFQTFPALDEALAYVAGITPAAQSAGLPLTGDVTLMLGIAVTAMPFAESTEDEAERWLRLLRRHGEAGVVLASLGVSEARIEGPRELVAGDHPEPGHSRVIASVTARASRIAIQRQAERVTTTDVLQAVAQVYGATFDRVLKAHGGDIEELATRLGS
jgi:hypothetical protein